MSQNELVNVDGHCRLIESTNASKQLYAWGKLNVPPQSRHLKFGSPNHGLRKCYNRHRLHIDNKCLIKQTPYDLKFDFTIELAARFTRVSTRCYSYSQT